MSDVMLLGVLRMPLPDDPADVDALTWLQFRDRARQAAARIDSDAAEIERLREDAERWQRAKVCSRMDQFGCFVINPDDPHDHILSSMSFEAAVDAARKHPTTKENT